MAALRTSWARGLLVLGAALLAAGPGALAGPQVLRLLLDGEVLESPREDAELAVLFGGPRPTTLLKMIQDLDEAADKPEIRGIALIVDEPTISLAQVEELSRALGRLRARGKQVYCYLDWASNVSYCLAAASSDHITLAENSELAVVGLHAEVSFYKKMLDKIGVQADMLQCGAYKAAAEPYMRTEPSPEFRENLNWLLDGLYERWIELIAQGRKLPVEQVRAAVDAAPLSAQQALQAGLVDAVGSLEDFKRMLRKEFGQGVAILKDLEEAEESIELDLENPFAVFSEMNRLMEKFFGGPDRSQEPGIGLVYVDGGIIVGKSQSDPLMGSTAGSTSVRAALEEARKDEKVRAVVLRVDSPGGSAIASDIIWQTATQLSREKPLIVSMGSVAGSGGYYVSTPGDTIFAEATSITASIGVVGGKLVWNDLWENKIGITTTEFDRGKHAALMSFNRPWTEQERDWMVQWMNQIYEQFKARIVASRGGRIQGDLESMAGGRVFTGRQALELGLVDRIGGLSDAIAYAAEKVGLVDPPVYVYPKKKELGEVLAQLMGRPTRDEWELAMRSPLVGDPLPRLAVPLLAELAPEQVRSLLRGLQNLSILSRERVGCMMAFDLRLR